MCGYEIQGNTFQNSLTWVLFAPDEKSISIYQHKHQQMTLLYQMAYFETLIEK